MRRDHRAERRQKTRKEKKEKVRAALGKRKAAPAITQELRRHSRRTARLERVGELAAEADDAEALALVDKLIAKENARHSKWLTQFAAAKGVSQ
jgi:hypothetical protein